MCDKQSKHCTSSPTGSSAASRSLILSGSLLRVSSGCLDGSSGFCLIIGHRMTLSGLTSFWSVIVTPTHQNRKVQTVSDFGAATPPALTQWGKHSLTLAANMNEIWVFIYCYFSSLAVMEQTSFVAGTKRWSPSYPLICVITRLLSFQGIKKVVMTSQLHQFVHFLIHLCNSGSQGFGTYRKMSLGGRHLTP